MPRFSRDDVEIAFLDEGEGLPVVLVHGFASNKEVNWVYTGWVTALASAGRRVIALDNRGHGESTKLYDPSAYHSATMAEDVRALLDHLRLAHADILGYSLGARITAFMALANPGRARSAVLGGLGMGLVDGLSDTDRIARALEAPALAEVSDPGGYTYRAFAEKTHSDLRALAACIRGARQTMSREEVGRIAVPLLIAVGENDQVAGSPEGLAALIPRATAFTIPGRDHMLAAGDRRFKGAVLSFLSQDGEDRAHPLTQN
jgi:pimeloyl-ACP methyl ester carboxylesterase